MSSVEHGGKADATCIAFGNEAICSNVIILIKATAEASLRWVAKLFMVCFPTVDAALMTALVYCLNSWLKHYNAPFLPPTVQVAWIQFTWIRGCLFYDTSFNFVDFCRWCFRHAAAAVGCGARNSNEMNRLGGVQPTAKQTFWKLNNFSCCENVISLFVFYSGSAVR